MAFDPKGQFLLSVSADGTLRVWDVRATSLAQTVQVSRGELYTSAISSDGNTVIVGSTDGIVSIWTLNSSDIPMPSHPFRPHPIMLTRPQRNQIVDLVVIDADTLLLTTWDTNRKLVDLTSEQLVDIGSTDITSIFDRSSSSRETQRQLNLISKQLNKQALNSRNFVFTLAKSSSFNKSLGNQIFEWDIVTLWLNSISNSKLRVDLKKRIGDNYNVATVSQNNKRLAFIYNNGTVLLLDREGNIFEGKHSIEKAIFSAFLNNSNTLVMGGEDGSILLIEPSFTRESQEWKHRYFQPHEDSVVYILSDEKRGRIISVTLSGELRSCLVESGEIVFQTQIIGLQAIALSSNGKWLATATLAGNLELRNPDNGDPIISLRRHYGSIKVLGFSWNSQKLYSGGFDETLRVWDIANIEKLLTQDWKTLSQSLQIQE